MNDLETVMQWGISIFVQRDNNTDTKPNDVHAIVMDTD